MALTARAATDRPTWSAGDFWVYGLRGYDIAGGPIGMNSTGTMRLDVLGIDAATPSHIAGPMYHVQAATTITQDGFVSEITEDRWYRTTDLALVESKRFTTVLSTTYALTAIYDPPLEIQWPLQAGTEWSTSTNVTGGTWAVGGPGSSTYSTSWSQQSTVETDEMVTVPAGAFTVTPVFTRFAAESTRAFWSPQAGNAVRHENFNSSGASRSSAELQSYHYANGVSASPLLVGIPIALAIGAGVAVLAFFLWRRRPRSPAMPPPDAEEPRASERPPPRAP